MKRYYMVYHKSKNWLSEVNHVANRYIWCSDWHEASRMDYKVAMDLSVKTGGKVFAANK